MIDPNLIPIETRSHVVADELIEVIHLEAAPEWMDSQINVRERDGVLSVEVVVLRHVAPLWAVIDVLGEPLGTTFVVDAIDQTTRTAYLPAAVVRGGEGPLRARAAQGSHGHSLGTAARGPAQPDRRMQAQLVRTGLLGGCD